ncbi:MAG: SMP-30/gluconolactonase/LRE family protein [Steroidobacteraceae bacterium]
MKFHTARTFVSLALLPGVWLSAGAADAPAPAPTPAATTTPAIAGVVNGGTPIQLVKDGFEAVEGPMRDTDGSLLFTNNQAGRVLRAAADGSITTWFEGPFGANALARTKKGEIVATLQKSPAIGVLQPGAPPRVLADRYDGKPFNRPNDLVADGRGNIYFTDPVPPGSTAPVGLPAVYQIGADGKLVLIATDIPRPNGIALSPSERTLYVANTSGEWLYAFDLDRKGMVGKRRDFAKLATPPAQGTVAAASGADGIAVDAKGRVYVATTLGVQVFSPKGSSLGVIAMPKQPQNLAFGGRDRSTLYVVGRGAVYRIATLTKGPDRAGK